MESQFGKILTGNEGRDAFHQAIIPLIVDDTYWSGRDWVKKIEGSNTKVQRCGSKDKNCIGFIDPYIHDTITESGKKVYIFLNQGLINDMRHHFSSPFFDEEDIISTDVVENNKPTLSDKQINAMNWLKNICEKNRLKFEIFENAKTTSDIYDEIHMFVKLNTHHGECYLEDLLFEIYDKFGAYKNIVIDRDVDDLYYIDWDCLNCN